MSGDQQMVIDTIRHAENESEIYALLTAQTERLVSAASLPANLRKLPIEGPDDLSSRCRALLIELDLASKQLDDNGCFAIKEALQIYGAALFRLRVLDSKSQSIRRMHNTQSAAKLVLQNVV